MLYEEISRVAEENDFSQTLKALPFAREKHEGQFRAGSEKLPYIWHPLMTAWSGACLGILEDEILAAALLHDVCEDCNVQPLELPAGKEVREAVRILTREAPPYRFTKEAQDKYYAGIAGNRIASVVKLLDRCNNVSTMSEAFPMERMIRYAHDTVERVYPLFDAALSLNPEYRDQILLIRYHMSSVLGLVPGKEQLCSEKAPVPVPAKKTHEKT